MLLHINAENEEQGPCVARDGYDLGGVGRVDSSAYRPCADVSQLSGNGRLDGRDIIIQGTLAIVCRTGIKVVRSIHNSIHIYFLCALGKAHHIMYVLALIP